MQLTHRLCDEDLWPVSTEAATLDLNPYYFGSIMKLINSLILVLAVFLIASLSHAEIYKSTDEQGRVIYTDNPALGKKVDQVDLPPINTQPATRLSNKSPNQKSKKVVYKVSISQPKQGTQIPTGQEALDLQVGVLPPPKSSYSLQAYLNGSPIGPSSKRQRWQLKALYRGEHQLTVNLIDDSGNVLASSDPVTIYVQRASKKLPATPVKSN